MITETHLRFWYQRAVSRPAWASTLPSEPVSIDLLVNLNAARRSPRIDRAQLEAHNLVAILRSARRRGAVRRVLEDVLGEPTSTVRRRALARKWLARMEVRS